MQKRNVFFVGTLVLSTQIVAQDKTPAYLTKDYQGYRLEEVVSADIDTIMPVADGANGLIPELRGLWWLDGVPIPDEVVSFAGADWDAAKGIATVKVYDQDIWSWHANESGAALYELVRKFELVYDVEFNRDKTVFTIVPTIKVAGLPFKIPTAVLKFTATRVDDDYYTRESYLFGELFNTYDFRRLVDENGNRTDSYDEYIAAAPEKTLLAKKAR